MSSPTVTHESRVTTVTSSVMPVSLPVWPSTLQAAFSDRILSVSYCPVPSYWYCESVNRVASMWVPIYIKTDYGRICGFKKGRHMGTF